MEGTSPTTGIPEGNNNDDDNRNTNTTYSTTSNDKMKSFLTTNYEAAVAQTQTLSSNKGNNEEKTSSSTASDDDEDTSSEITHPNSKEDQRTYTFTATNDMTSNPKIETRFNTNDDDDSDDSETDNSSSKRSNDEDAMDCGDDANDITKRSKPNNNIIDVDMRGGKTINNVASTTTKTKTTFDDGGSSSDDESLNDNDDSDDSDDDDDSSNSDLNDYRTTQNRTSTNHNNSNKYKEKEEHPKHIYEKDITLMTSDDDSEDDDDDDSLASASSSIDVNDVLFAEINNNMDDHQNTKKAEIPTSHNSNNDNSSSNKDDLETKDKSNDGNLEAIPRFDSDDSTKPMASSKQKESEEDNMNMEKVVPSPMYKKVNGKRQQQKQQSPTSGTKSFEQLFGFVDHKPLPVSLLPPKKAKAKKRTRTNASKQKWVSTISLRVPTDALPGLVRFTVGEYSPDRPKPEIMKSKQKKGSGGGDNFASHHEPVDITQPHEHDVLCGRGGLTNSHIGNEWFRRLVRLNKSLYHESPKHSKLMVAKSIVQAVYQRNPPGRFIEIANRKEMIWHEISHKRAIDKSSQALREKDAPGSNDMKFQAVSEMDMKHVKSQQLKEKDMKEEGHMKHPGVVVKDRKRNNQEEVRIRQDECNDIAVLQAQLAKEKADRMAAEARLLQAQLAKEKADRMAAEARLAEYEKQQAGVNNIPPHPSTNAAFSNPNNNHHHRMSIHATTDSVFDSNLRDQTSLPAGIGTLSVSNSHQNATMISPSSRVTTNSQLMNAMNPLPMSPPMLNNSAIPTGLSALSPLSNTKINNGTIMATMNNSSAMSSAAMMASPLIHNQNNQNFYNSPLSTMANPNWAVMNSSVMNSSPIGTTKTSRPMPASVTAAAAAMTSPMMTSPAMTETLLKRLNIRVNEHTVANTPPQDADVVCGRGGAALRHRGNQFYRRLVELNKALYVASPKHGKLKVSRGIVNTIYNRNGRFMEKEPNKEIWYVISDKKALEKTSQALREDQEEFRRKMLMKAASQIPLNSSLSQGTTVQDYPPAGMISMPVHSQPYPGSSIQNSNPLRLPNDRGDSSINRNQDPAVPVPPPPPPHPATASAKPNYTIPLNSNGHNDAMNPNYVYRVTEHDVLCGRGVNIAQHPGNMRFRALVKTRRDDAYCNNFTTNEKKALAWEIVKHIQSLDPPGRFLVQASPQQKTLRYWDGPWTVLGQKECIEKACQALHDCNRQDRPDYAADVAVPDDVKKNAEEREKQGLSLKEHAAAIATRMPPPVSGVPAQILSFEEERHRRALEFALTPSTTTKAKQSSTHAARRQKVDSKTPGGGKAKSKTTTQKQAGIKRKEALVRDTTGFVTSKELKSAVKIVKTSKAEGFPGVTMKPSGSWQAQVYYGGSSRYIGLFDTREKAALAFVIAKEKLKSKEHFPEWGSLGPERLEEACFEAARTAAFAGVSKIYPSPPTSSCNNPPRKKHKADNNKAVDNCTTNNEGKSGRSKSGKTKTKVKKGKKGKKLPTKPAKILQLYLPSIIGGHRGLIHN